MTDINIILPGFIHCPLPFPYSLIDSADVVVDWLELRDFFCAIGSSSSLIVRSMMLRFLELIEGS